MGLATTWPLERFFARTVKPFFLLTGGGTALVGLYAFAPAWTVPNIGQLPYLQEYTIIIQHWGMMVGLMGVAMMSAAVVPAWRLPIFLYSAVEKAFMVWLVLSNAQQPFVSGFWVPFALDSTVVLYTIGYFAACGFRHPPDRPSGGSSAGGSATAVPGGG
jgi:hypothetical protein